MSSRSPRRLVSVVLVAVLATGPFMRPARAMLTELAVGSTLLLQTLAVVTELLPQITELTTNMLSLYRTGNQLADTVSKIFKDANPGPKKKGKTPPPAAVPQFTVPVIQPVERAEGGDEPHEEAPAEEPPSPADESDGDLADKVARLASTYQKQQALLNGMQAGGDVDKSAMRAGFERLQQSLDRQTDTVSQELSTAFEKNETDTVNGFLDAAGKLEGPGRKSLAPVLARFMETARFLVLYDGDLAQKPEYAALKTLHQDLRGDE